MAKITRMLAEQLVNTLTEKKQKELQDVENAFKKKLTEIYRKSLPDQIMKLWEDPITKPYLDTTTQLRMFSQGFNGNYLRVEESPASESHPIFKIDDKISVKLADENTAIKKKAEELKDLKQKLEQAFLNLGTYKRVIEQFPETETLLDMGSKNQIAIPDYSFLREKLNQ